MFIFSLHYIYSKDDWCALSSNTCSLLHNYVAVFQKCATIPALASVDENIKYIINIWCCCDRVQMEVVLVDGSCVSRFSVCSATCNAHSSSQTVSRRRSSSLHKKSLIWSAFVTRAVVAGSTDYLRAYTCHVHRKIDDESQASLPAYNRKPRAHLAQIKWKIWVDVHMFYVLCVCPMRMATRWNEFRNPQHQAKNQTCRQQTHSSFPGYAREQEIVQYSFARSFVRCVVRIIFKG